MPTPLERPEPPAVTAPLEWTETRVIAVFGPGDRAFAEAIRGARPEAALIEVTLRHAPGCERRGEVLVTHPDALLEALTAARPQAPLVLGVGAAFAVAVRADLAIWIADGLPLMALPPPVRGVARDAGLVLEEARLGVAERLAAEI